MCKTSVTPLLTHSHGGLGYDLTCLNRVPVPASDPAIAITSIQNLSDKVFSGGGGPAPDAAAGTGPGVGSTDGMEGEPEEASEDIVPNAMAAAPSALPSNSGEKVHAPVLTQMLHSKISNVQAFCTKGCV